MTKKCAGAEDQVLVLRRIRCRLCGKVLESLHRHDCQSCECGTMVDGGYDYCRLGYPEGMSMDQAIEDLSVYIDRRDLPKCTSCGKPAPMLYGWHGHDAFHTHLCLSHEVKLDGEWGSVRGCADDHYPVFRDRARELMSGRGYRAEFAIMRWGTPEALAFASQTPERLPPR